jgi:hypothetical protein
MAYAKGTRREYVVHIAIDYRETNDNLLSHLVDRLEGKMADRGLNASVVEVPMVLMEMDRWNAVRSVMYPMVIDVEPGVPESRKRRIITESYDEISREIEDETVMLRKIQWKK